MAGFLVTLHRSAALVLAVGLGDLGCAESVAGVTLDRAAYDLNCPVDKIQVRPGVGGAAMAEGCNRSVSYSCVRTRGAILCKRAESGLPPPAAR